MKTVESVITALTNTDQIMAEVEVILREIDPNFIEEEKQFNTACKQLLTKFDGHTTPSVSAYLQAYRAKFVSSIIFIAGQGLQLNAEIFYKPVNALFLQKCDFEELHRERLLGTLPNVQAANKVVADFSNAARTHPNAGEIQMLNESVISMYSYLQTVGYKLAHYFGFLLADKLLPYIIPGYQRDPVNTFQYNREISEYLGINIDKLGEIWSA